MSANQDSPTGAGSGRGSHLDRLRGDNLSTVLRLVHRAGALSRAQIAELTGLNRSTVATLVGELEDRQLVRQESAATQTKAGRPSQQVVANERVVVVAVNPEVDAITIGLVGLGGVVHRVIRREMPAVPTTSAATDAVVQVLADLADELAGYDAVVGIGCAVPGLVRADDGLVKMAPHLGWVDEPFAAQLTAATGHQVWVGNDANLGMLAESTFGAARGVLDVVYVNGGASGIGTGVLTGGTLLAGTTGYAGELGHILVRSDGQRCECGATGCLETEVRQDRLLRAAGLATADPGALGSVLASSTNPAVVAVLDEQLGYLAVGLRAAINLFNPSLIVLGGFLAALHAARPEYLHELVTRSALRPSGIEVRLAPAELAEHRLLIGAAELGLQTLPG